MRKLMYAPFIIAILAPVVDIFFNLPEYDLPVGVWIFILLMILQVIILAAEGWLKENAKPVIKLKSFGFEIKEWKGFNSGRDSVCAYIDVYNEPKKGSLNDVNSRGVYPTIVWTGDDRDRKENHGRWWVANEDQVGARPLQTVDLEANGNPQRLHFAYAETTNQGLQVLFRTADGKTDSKMLGQNAQNITIHLRDNSVSEANFFFKLTTIRSERWPNMKFRLEQLNTENGSVVGVQFFDLEELVRFEKEKGVRQ